MRYIVNNYDTEIKFDNLMQAKAYMITDYKPIEEDYIGDDFECYKKNYEEYINGLSSADNLDELARIWNAYTDMFANGSTYEVKEV